MQHSHGENGTFLATDVHHLSTTETPELWSETQSILYFSFYAGALFLTLIVFGWHSYNLSSDLCTKSRSVHRRKKPPLTTQYKLINYLTDLSILLYIVYLLVCTVQMTDSNYDQCVITTYLWTYPWLMSKATMYCIFLLRLDMVYGQSVYGYNRNILYFLMAVVVLCSLSLSSLLISDLSIENSQFLTDDDMLPNPCFVYFPSWGYSSFLVYDFIAMTICLVLFIVPLTRAVRAVRERGTKKCDINQIKASDRMIYVGVKMMIVTAVCVFTTVLTLSLLTSGYVGYMCAVDVVVNCVCLAMMTGYYPDFKYYERLCFLCLLCCPKRYRNKKALMSRTDTFAMLDSKSSTTGVVTKESTEVDLPALPNMTPQNSIGMPSATDMSPQNSMLSAVSPTECVVEDRHTTNV